MLDQYLAVSPLVEGQLSVDVDLDKVANQLALDSAPLLELAGATLKVGRLPVVRASRTRCTPSCRTCSPTL